jgi:hypothetical protein
VNSFHNEGKLFGKEDVVVGMAGSMAMEYFRQVSTKVGELDPPPLLGQQHT